MRKLRYFNHTSHIKKSSPYFSVATVAVNIDSHQHVAKLNMIKYLYQIMQISETEIILDIVIQFEHTLSVMNGDRREMYCNCCFRIQNWSNGQQQKVDIKCQ